MKLRITDKFLWDIYNAIDKTGDILSFITKPPTMANYLLGSRDPIFEKYKKQSGRKKFNQLIYQLKRNNYIKVESLKGVKAIILTSKGLGKVLKTSFKVGNNIKRKDGKWIMLIFDMPAKYKKSRDLLRSVLQNLGYKVFQHSVWITPYDVFEKTERYLQFYSLDRFIKIFLIEEL